MSISRSSRRASFGTLHRASALAAVSLACALCSASVDAQEPAATEGEPSQEPSQAAPTVPTNAPAPEAIAREPVARADDVAFDSDESSQAVSFVEPTFNSETTRMRVPNVRLLATGSLVLVSAYLPAVIGGAVSNRAGDNNLYIPVAGPFLAMSRGAGEKPGHKALFVADGIAQGLGGLGVLLSFMIPEKITERWYLIGKRVRVAPARVARGYGVSATGSF